MQRKWLLFATIIFLMGCAQEEPRAFLPTYTPDPQQKFLPLPSPTPTLETRLHIAKESEVEYLAIQMFLEFDIEDIDCKHAYQLEKAKAATYCEGKKVARVGSLVNYITYDNQVRIEFRILVDTGFGYVLSECSGRWGQDSACDTYTVSEMEGVALSLEPVVMWRDLTEESR